VHRHGWLSRYLDWILSSCMATSLEISGEFSCPNGWPKWLSISWVLKVNVDNVGFEDVSGTAFSFLISAFLQTSSLHKRVVWTDRLVDWGPHDFTDISSVCDSGMAISTWLLRMSLLGVEGKDNKAWWSPLEVAEFSPFAIGHFGSVRILSAELLIFEVETLSSRFLELSNFSRNDERKNLLVMVQVIWFSKKLLLELIFSVIVVFLIFT